MKKTITFVSIYYSLLLLVVVSVVEIHAQEDDANKKFLNYQNSTYGITIDYPYDHEKDETNYYNNSERVTSIVRFWAPLESDSNYYNTISINFDNIPYIVNLSDYLYETIEAYKGLQNFQLIDSNLESMLSDNQAYSFTYTYEEKSDDANDEEKSTTFKVFEIGTIVNNKGYFIEFFAEEDKFLGYEQILEDVIKSFRFIDSEDHGNITSPSNEQSVITTKSYPGNDFKIYRNSNFGIESIEYPSNFLIQFGHEFDLPDDGVIDIVRFETPFHTVLDTFPDDVRFSVSTIPMSSSRDIHQNALSFIEEIKKLEPEFSLVEINEDEKLSGFPAFKVIYKTRYDYSDTSLYLTKMFIGSIVGDKFYSIIYTAEDNQYEYFLPTINKIISSFKIDKNIIIDEGMSYGNASRSIVSTSVIPKSIELSLEEWITDNINVYILINADTQEQSKKYTDVAVQAVKTWSDILKNTSGNMDAWNFNIETFVGYLDQLNIDSSNTIIIELIGGMECGNFLGLAPPAPDDLLKPVTSTVLTSCNIEGEIEELTMETVYNSVLHEFGHNLGLGHAWNINQDLMCSTDYDAKGYAINTCDEFPDDSFKLIPSEDDINAILYKYGKDGFKQPNRDLKQLGFRPIYISGTPVDMDIKPQNIMDKKITENHDITTSSSDSTIQETNDILNTNTNYMYDYNTTEAYFNNGLTSYYEGKYEEAIQWYDEVLDIDPTREDALYNKGLAFYYLNQFENAIIWFEKAIKINPSDLDAILNMGLSFANLGKYDEAIMLYDEVLQKDKTSVKALNNKGNIFFELGEYDKAIMLYDEALSVDPNFELAIKNKELALEKIER